MWDDKDPPWVNSRIKSLLESKNKLCKMYRRFESNSHLISKPSLLQEQLYILITQNKIIMQEWRANWLEETFKKVLSHIGLYQTVFKQQ